MLTAVERVMILKGIDLLEHVGPRHLIALARAAREEEIWSGQTIYREHDVADALYVVVEGRVQLSIEGRVLSEVGPGEAFGTWALIDDSERGQQADCLQDGVALALLREDFYEAASEDVTLLQELVRVLARRLRTLVEVRPEEARVEGEGIQTGKEATEDRQERPGDGRGGESASPEKDKGASRVPQPTAGASLEAAILDRPAPAPEGGPEDPQDGT